MVTMPRLRRSRHQQVEAAKLEVAAEDGPDPLGLGLIDGDLAVLRVIAKRRHAADPKTLALGGRDLVPDALRGDLALELGERQQHIQRQPAHRGGGIELLGDGDERHIMLVEQLDQLGEVRQRPGQPVDLVDDDDVDLAGLNVLQQPLQGRAVDVAAGEAAIVVFGSEQRPSGMRLTADIGLRGIILGVQRVEVLLEPIAALSWFAGAGIFTLRSCRRVCRRAGSRRAEARRNLSPRCLRGTKPRAPSLPG